LVFHFATPSAATCDRRNPSCGTAGGQADFLRRPPAFCALP
jgi:hypothetical protein